jgi:hypothetical protein
VRSARSSTGPFLILVAYLVFRSGFMPRAIGVLLVLGGLGWLTFLSPPLAKSVLTEISVLGFFAEAALMLWLLVMGVKGDRWEERAGYESESSFAKAFRRFMGCTPAAYRASFHDGPPGGGVVSPPEPEAA